ncbi:hypothetical protein JZ751_021679 [Albula glossodonta]|uniref:Extended synaptotagmin-like protein 1a n=1 Tax=Albula glossodonta TaxID=121402 RepID=A0A8T2NRS8_9TELE|nr:hypothetical protein JZ751_021679 [Albula glossodonta]
MPTGDAGPARGMGTEAAGSAHSGVSEPNPMELQPPRAPGVGAVSVLWSFGKCLGALLPVYLAGYFGFSISLVIFGLMVYMGWKQSRHGKDTRLQSAMYLLENEQDFTTTRILRSKRDLPSWVNFPDVEKVEWLNKILQQAWPFVGQYLEKLLVETIAPSIRASSAHLQTLSFTKVNLGDKAMKVVGVKAHTEHDKRQVLLDLYISYAGDVEINVEVKKYFCKAGVKGIQLHGKLRVILEPLIGDVPLVGAITMFFIRRPKLDINWTGLTNLLDIPGLNAMSDTLIMDAIASFLVLPNRLTVPLVADLHVAQLRSPLPRGIVRIHLLEAENLAPKDNYIKGVIAGKSDPYAVLRVGTQTFTSHHVDNNLNPQWREMYEVIVHEVPGQELEVEVFDKDPDQDDFLGRVKLDLGLVKKARLLDEVLKRNKDLAIASKTAEAPSAAILAVYLDRAQELPTCYGTNNPQWEDAFTFFIQDPGNQNIDIEVKDDDRALSLGSLSIPLARLLISPEMTLDQWFQLEDSGPASRIYINIILRILWLNEEAAGGTPVSPMPPDSGAGDGDGGNTAEVTPGGTSVAPVPSQTRPQQTSPDPSFATEGVLRIHLVEAQNLIAKDNFMGGMVKGKSDPYVKIRVGGVTFRSHVIKENLNPTWNELYEVYDKDLDQDDFLGRFKISLRDVINSQYTDEWYTLNDVKSGQVHLVLEWLPRVTDPAKLDQVLQHQSQQFYKNKVTPSAAILFVYVERAHGLPLKKSGKEPKAGVELTVKGTSQRTKVCDRSTSPQWDESFYFLLRCPRDDMLIVKLSHSWGLSLGSLVLPVRELLAEPGLALDRWLSLDGALPESEILLRATLQILESKASVCAGGPGGPEEGESVIPSREATTAANQELRHRAMPTHGGGDHPESDKGQVKLSIYFSTEENRLVIIVHGCRNLAACAKDGSDPYVSFILSPDKNRTTKRKTSIKKRDLNPEFNERRLDLSVKNSVSFMSRERELIGKVQVELAEIDLSAGVTQWYVGSKFTNVMSIMLPFLYLCVTFW